MCTRGKKWRESILQILSRFKYFCLIHVNLCSLTFFPMHGNDLGHLLAERKMQPISVHKNHGHWSFVWTSCIAAFCPGHMLLLFKYFLTWVRICSRREQKWIVLFQYASGSVKQATFSEWQWDDYNWELKSHSPPPNSVTKETWNTGRKLLQIRKTSFDCHLLEILFSSRKQRFQECLDTRERWGESPQWKYDPLTWMPDHKEALQIWDGLWGPLVVVLPLLVLTNVRNLNVISDMMAEARPFSNILLY